MREKFFNAEHVTCSQMSKVCSAVTNKETDIPTSMSYWGNCLGKLKSQRDDYMMSDANRSYCSAEVSLREKFVFNAEHGTYALE